MHEDKIVGVDLAKNTFQVAVMTRDGEIVANHRVRRDAVFKTVTAWSGATVGLEACNGAQYWARQFQEAGHAVRLMPAEAVKAYATPGRKSDKADAAAIAEAASRPQVRSVPVKSVSQQAVQSVQRSVGVLTRQRTQLINTVRAHLLEFGITLPKGAPAFRKRFPELYTSEAWLALPTPLRETLIQLFGQVQALDEQIKEVQAPLREMARRDEASRRLQTIPGIGPRLATATRAAIGEGRQFACGRSFADWLGLAPGLYASGETVRLGPITRRGNGPLRALFVLGAQSLLKAEAKQKAKGRPPRDRLAQWIRRKLASKPWNAAATAVANKLARIVWAVLVKGGGYEPRGA